MTPDEIRRSLRRLEDIRMEVLASNSPARLTMYRLGRRVQDFYESSGLAESLRELAAMPGFVARSMVENVRSIPGSIPGGVNSALQAFRFIASSLGQRLASWNPRNLPENLRVASFTNLRETDDFLRRTWNAARRTWNTATSMGPAISQTVNRSLAGMGRRNFNNLMATNDFLIRTSARAKAFGGDVTDELKMSVNDMASEMKSNLDFMREGMRPVLQDLASIGYDTYVLPVKELMSTVNEVVRDSMAIQGKNTGQVADPDKLLSQELLQIQKEYRQLLNLLDENSVPPTSTEVRRTATLGTSHSPNGGEVINSWRENFHQMVSRSQDNLQG